MYDRYDEPLTNAAQEAYAANAYFHFQAYVSNLVCECGEPLTAHADPETMLCDECVAYEESCV